MSSGSFVAEETVGRLMSTGGPPPTFDWVKSAGDGRWYRVRISQPPPVVDGRWRGDLKLQAAEVREVYAELGAQLVARFPEVVGAVRHERAQAKQRAWAWAFPAAGWRRRRGRRGFVRLYREPAEARPQCSPVVALAIAEAFRVLHARSLLWAVRS